jgi:hypothetical protein
MMNESNCFCLQFIIPRSSFIVSLRAFCACGGVRFTTRARAVNISALQLKTFLTSRTLIHIEALSFNGTCVFVGSDIASGSVWSCRKNVV